MPVATVHTVRLQFDGVTLNFPVPSSASATTTLAKLRTMIAAGQADGGFPSSFLFEYMDDVDSDIGQQDGRNNDNFRRIRVLRSMEGNITLDDLNGSSLYLFRTAVVTVDSPTIVLSTTAATVVSTQAKKRPRGHPKGTKSKHNKVLKSGCVLNNSSNTATATNAAASTQAKKRPVGRPKGTKHNSNKIPKVKHGKWTTDSSAWKPTNCRQGNSRGDITAMGEELQPVESILERKLKGGDFVNSNLPSSYLYKVRWANNNSKINDGYIAPQDSWVPFTALSPDLQRGARNREWGSTRLVSGGPMDKTEPSPSLTTSHPQDSPKQSLPPPLRRRSRRCMRCVENGMSDDVASQCLGRTFRGRAACVHFQDDAGTPQAGWHSHSPYPAPTASSSGSMVERVMSSPMDEIVI